MSRSRHAGLLWGNGWHGSVHVAIGGTMQDAMIASAAPIFWCWHGYVDHVYWDWQRCQPSPSPSPEPDTFPTGGGALQVAFPEADKKADA